MTRSENLIRGLSSLDLTTLTDADSDEVIKRLCGRALTPHGKVAAVCLYPRFVELAAAELDYVRGQYLPSLAYRLVQVASGVFDAAVVRRGAQDWDIAGAASILGECGIGFEDVCVGQLRFNRAEIRHGALAAAADDSLKAVLHAALVRVYGCPSEDADAAPDS